jgi:hypothetical protein
MKKSILALIPIFSSVFISVPTQAGRFEPVSGKCWFFRGEELEIEQSCTLSGYSWAGGGYTVLRWEDGVKTVISFGKQGRGSRPCQTENSKFNEEVAVDGVCGEWYHCDLETLEPVEADSSNREELIRCVAVNGNSVCYNY